MTKQNAKTKPIQGEVRYGNIDSSRHPLYAYASFSTSPFAAFTLLAVKL